MKLLTVQPRALLIQDVSEYLAILRPIVRSVIEQYTFFDINEQMVIDWIMKEELERTCHLLSVNHNPANPLFRRIYDQIRNMVDLNLFTGWYVKTPNLYGDHCYVDVEIRGIDLFMWYFKQEQTFPANYSYIRRWN